MNKIPILFLSSNSIRMAFIFASQEDESRFFLFKLLIGCYIKQVNSYNASAHILFTFMDIKPSFPCVLRLDLMLLHLGILPVKECSPIYIPSASLYKLVDNEREAGYIPELQAKYCL